MGHLTNPISYRLGKKIWWRDEYLTWSKSNHLFYSMRSFLDRFLSSFFGRINRFEYQGIFYFGSKLLIGRKVYLYIFLQDQKAQRFLYRRRFFQRKRKKRVYKMLTRKKERLMKDIKKGCRKFIAKGAYL
jgi:hypothetical protein